jgi:hypothetical protein
LWKKKERKDINNGITKEYIMSEPEIRRNEARADKILQESLNIESDESNCALDVVTNSQKLAYEQGKKLAMLGEGHVKEFIDFFSKGVKGYRKESKTITSDSTDLIEIAKDFC